MKKRKLLLLVSLSAERERLLRADPELVRDLVHARTRATIPGTLELDERWIELQRALFDYQWLSGSDDPQAEALTPRSGLGLYEDRNIDSARVVAADRCRAIAAWVAALPRDCIEQARRAEPSPASRDFPESLGSSEADDHEPLVEGTKVSRERVRYESRELAETLERVRAFYADVQRAGRAVLALRFRE